MFFWTVLFSGGSSTTGGSISMRAVVRAPTAADALVMFDVGTRKRNQYERWFRGAEGIRLATDEEAADRSLRLLTEHVGVSP